MADYGEYVNMSPTLQPYVRDPAQGTPLGGWGDRGSLPISHLRGLDQSDDWRREYVDSKPSLPTSKPAFALIPGRVIFILVVAYMVSGWRILLGGVTKCGDPGST
jgi:hypothetical protein